MYALFEADENRAGMNASWKNTNATTLKKVLKVMEPDGRHSKFKKSNFKKSEVILKLQSLFITQLESKLM